MLSQILRLSSETSLERTWETASAFHSLTLAGIKLATPYVYGPDAGGLSKIEGMVNSSRCFKPLACQVKISVVFQKIIYFSLETRSFHG